MNVETREIEVIADSFEDQPLVRPNDVTIDGQGRIYFTDYAGAAVYRIGADGVRTAFGIHAYGGATNNSATRITTPVYQNLLNWVNA